jgi:hypothetical protein
MRPRRLVAQHRVGRAVLEIDAEISRHNLGGKVHAANDNF